MVLEYAGGDKLYVPVQQLHLVSRHWAQRPKVHRWQSSAPSIGESAQTRADKIRDVAGAVDLDGAAPSEARPASPHAELEYQAFASSFPSRNADQAEAIRQVRPIWRPRSRWIAWRAATSASARPSRRCRPRSSPRGRKAGPPLVPTTARRTAHQRLPRSSSPVGAHRDARFRTGQESMPCSKASNRHRRYRDRGASAVARQCRFKDLGSSSLTNRRRARQGAQDAARRSARAHVDGDADFWINMALGGYGTVVDHDAAVVAARNSDVSSPSGTRRRCARRRCAVPARQAEACTSCRTWSKPSTRRRRNREALPKGRSARGHGQMRERDLEQLMVDLDRS